MKNKVITLLPISEAGARKELQELLDGKEIVTYYEALKKVHYLGTYFVPPELVDLSASASIHQLLDVMQKVVMEEEGRGLEECICVWLVPSRYYLELS